MYTNQAKQPRFRELVGRTVSAEIWRVRTARATDLLARTDWTLAEVAAAAGFTNIARLSRKVREETGQCPREYRAQRRSH